MKRRRFIELLSIFLLSSPIISQTRVGGRARVGGKVNVGNSVSGGGGGSDFVTDSYTEAGASTQDLSTHTGELGATWTDHPHANYTATALVDQSTDRVFSNGTAAYYTSGIPPNANYYVQATIFLHSAITQSMGVAGRMDTTNDTMYLGRLVDGINWQLRKIVNGTATTLGSTSTTNIPTVGNGAVLKLIMNGDQISLEAGGTVVIGPITDTAITAAGKAGLRNNGTATASTGSHIDSFSARGL